jgi:hypothetical protein
LLFSLLGQSFQDVGLTEWASVVAKQCPDDADWTKANFNKCIRDYLEAVAGFPNIGNQLICWLHTAKKACSHANARVHAALSAASQLPQEGLPPSNNGRNHGAREE